MLSSVIDISIITTLATRGILMTPLQPSIVVTTFAAAAVFAFVLDQVKHLVFMRLKMA
jgi:H+-transporting ATPase